MKIIAAPALDFWVSLPWFINGFAKRFHFLVMFFHLLQAIAVVMNPILYAGLGLAVLCIVTAGLMRTPLGLPLGWLCQLLTFLTAYIVPMMFAVGLLFLGLWVLCLVQGAKAERLVEEREAAAAVD